MSFQTITFEKALEQLYLNLGKPISEKTPLTDRNQKAFELEQAVKDGWEYAWWPMLMKLEQRTYRPPWAVDDTYATEDVVWHDPDADEDGNYYVSLVDDNLGIEPAGSDFLEFNGSSTKVSYPTDATYALGTADFEFSCKINTELVAGLQRIFSMYVGGADGISVDLINGAVRITDHSGGESAVGPSTLVAGTEYNIRAVKSGTTGTVYINETAGTPNTNLEANLGGGDGFPPWIGTDEDGDAAFFQGIISDPVMKIGGVNRIDSPLDEGSGTVATNNGTGTNGVITDPGWVDPSEYWQTVAEYAAENPDWYFHRYIAWCQADETRIPVDGFNMDLGFYRGDPRSKRGGFKKYVVQDGIWRSMTGIEVQCARPPDEPWIWFRCEAPRFTANEYADDTTYLADTLVYWPTAESGTGDCYLSLQDANIGNDPSDTDWWERQSFPRFLYDFAMLAAKSRLLTEDEGRQRAGAQSMKELYRVEDVVFPQAGAGNRQNFKTMY